MATRDNVHPISDADLEKHLKDAEFRMQNVPMRGVAYDLLSEVRKLPGVGGYLLSESVNHTLHVLRRALCLYYELTEELSGSIDPQQTQFIGSYALFAAAALAAHELPEPKGENLASFPKPGDGYFRVGLGPDDDLKSLLSFYLRAVTQNAADGDPIVETAEDLLNITRDYLTAARDQMIAESERHPAELLAHVNNVTFRIGELELRGFGTSAQRSEAKVEFSPVLPDQVVGNTAAKRALLRYMDRLALFDAAKQMNPILELGGLPSTVLFDGFPGTGKSSLFRMAMTRLRQRGEQVGLPAQFVMIDTSIKDEYYGKTGKLLRERLDTVRDTTSLVLLFFDDIDLLMVSRSGGSGGDSGSDRDILTITMQFLDGVLTRYLGNYQTYAATNEPTALDAALRQRFHHRDLIAGPEDWDDYAALIGMKLSRQLKTGIVAVGGELPSIQAAAQSQGEAAQPKGGNGATGGGLLSGLLGGRKSVGWRELGELCVEFKRKNPRFTGRPIESVTQKLLAESADFDVPEAWFSDPTIFVQKSYDEKVALLKTLYRPITGEMIATELEHYFQSEQRYVDDAKVQRVERLAADMEAQLAARDILTQRAGQE